MAGLQPTVSKDEVIGSDKDTVHRCGELDRSQTTGVEPHLKDPSEDLGGGAFDDSSWAQHPVGSLEYLGLNVEHEFFGVSYDATIQPLRWE
jgi:hypothetical protein